MNARVSLLVIATCWFALLSSSSPAVSADDPRVIELIQEANTYSRQGDLEQAIAKLKEAAKLAPGNDRVSFQLGSFLASMGRFEEAGPVFAAVVAIDPQNSAARRGEITAIIVQGRYRDARRKLEEGLVAIPRDGQLAHTLARLTATAPLDEVRDGGLALQLALKVYEVVQNYETGETVAMAYAETGRYEQAVAQQRKLIEKAEQAGDSKRLETLNQRLLTYLRNEPWRAASPTEIAMATEPPRPGGSR